MSAASERERRWRLALGETGDAAMSERDLGIAEALDALYAADGSGPSRGGLGRSAPRVSRWLGDIRGYFPASVVQVIQKDALDRLGLKQMLLQPEFLAAVEADVHLVADLIALRAAMPDRTIETARMVVAKVVAELTRRLEGRMVEAIRGALDRARRTRRPRSAEIDWPRTITANLRHYQPEHRTIVPETLIGYGRRRRADLDEVVLCVDQSGSMAPSVVYSSIFATVMASVPAIRTRLVCFDTAVVDLTEDLADPVSVLFGIQLGGGTNINAAVAYCEERIERPTRTHLILITDLVEGGDARALIARLAGLVSRGVNVVVLLALTDTGAPAHHAGLARATASLGIPVFACTPDQFPDLMATALNRGDVHAWAAREDIKTIRGGEE
jgi:Mg-chelatase subunit ChlD